MSSLLIPGKFIMYLPSLAHRIGIHEAIISQYLYSFQSNSACGKEVGGRNYILLSVEKIAARTGMTYSQARHALDKMRRAGYLLVIKRPGIRKAKRYHVDTEAGVFKP